jgi:hypothetical protein
MEIPKNSEPLPDGSGYFAVNEHGKVDVYVIDGPLVSPAVDTDRQYTASPTPEAPIEIKLKYSGPSSGLVDVIQAMGGNGAGRMTEIDTLTRQTQMQLALMAAALRPAEPTPHTAIGAASDKDAAAKSDKPSTNKGSNPRANPAPPDSPLGSKGNRIPVFHNRASIRRIIATVAVTTAIIGPSAIRVSNGGPEVQQICAPNGMIDTITNPGCQPLQIFNLAMTPYDFLLNPGSDK